MKARLMGHMTSVPVSLKKFAEAQSTYSWQKKHAVNCVVRKGGRAFFLSSVSQ